jgi:2-methylcitrate dehydratase PrpD
MTSIAQALANWAHQFKPDDDDVALAQRCLQDTLAVTLAARAHPLARLATTLDEAGRWAVIGHVLDFDDLHMESTTHISAVCVPATLAVGGDAGAFLAGAGVLARLGVVLGWRHYSSGWHITCTAGAPAAAVAAAVAMGLPPAGIATAMALAVPGAGGVQRSFGTDGKSLQVGFAVSAGIRAARLAALGADADPAALDEWVELVGGSPARLDLAGAALPGGLAIKIYPCCYALQRPIHAVAGIRSRGLDPATVTEIVLRTPAATLAPLIHHRPTNGLQAKFSIEYAVAAALLDEHQGFDSFTDDATRRAEARRLMTAVKVDATPGGDWLLDGTLEVAISTTTGDVLRASEQFPPGSPQRPATAAEFSAKLSDCLRGIPTEAGSWTWRNAASVLRTHL